MKVILLFIVFVCITVQVQAQEDSTWVRYTGGFELRDGVYKDFNAFRNNAPTLAKEDLRDDQGLKVVDIRRVVSKMYRVGENGERQEIRKDALWGFCQNGAVYIAAGNGFYRIGLMGSLGHMVYEMSYRDWDPYMYPYGGVTRTILMQQMLDMRSGEFLPFTASGMDKALQKDEILLEEFRTLPKKQRNSSEALFRFLRMYNERTPLYFPE